MRGGDMVPAGLYPRLGLRTADGGTTSLRYDPSRDSLVQFVTVVHDEKIDRDISVAWNICARCHLYITLCDCQSGPDAPSYIKYWNGRPDQTSSTASEPPATYAMPDNFRKPEYNPLTGRKVRSDKGVKRGPRQAAPVNPTEAT